MRFRAIEAPSDTAKGWTGIMRVLVRRPPLNVIAVGGILSTLVIPIDSASSAALNAPSDEYSGAPVATVVDSDDNTRFISNLLLIRQHVAPPSIHGRRRTSRHSSRRLNYDPSGLLTGMQN
jgi:hypothetical protein